MCILCQQLGLETSLSRSTAKEVDATDVTVNPIAQRSIAQNLITTPQPVSPGVGDSFYPNFGNGGYDGQKYTLDLNVTDVNTSNLDATTTIAANATQDLSSFNLDFIGFNIEGITVDGKPATFSRDGQELTITPSEAIANGKAFSVVVDYSGSPQPINSVAFTFEVPTGWVQIDGGSFLSWVNQTVRTTITQSTTILLTEPPIRFASRFLTPIRLQPMVTQQPICLKRLTQ
jgi:hypothetical protein